MEGEMNLVETTTSTTVKPLSAVHTASCSRDDDRADLAAESALVSGEFDHLLNEFFDYASRLQQTLTGEGCKMPETRTGPDKTGSQPEQPVLDEQGWQRQWQVLEQQEQQQQQRHATAQPKSIWQAAYGWLTSSSSRAGAVASNPT